MKIAAALCSLLFAVGLSPANAFGTAARGGNGLRRPFSASAGPKASRAPGPLSMAPGPLGETGTGGGEPVVIGKDFRLSAIFLSAGLLLDQIPYLQLTLGPLVTVLGVLFLVQTFRLNFVCDDRAFSLEDTTNEDSVGENIVVGGENRWDYDSFVNFEFFPKGWIDQPQGPILVYFKETQTPSDKWNEGPGASANSDKALSEGAVRGQVHFFPALCDTQQLRSVWEKNCAKL